jgi:hypothetical protein
MEECALMSKPTENVLKALTDHMIALLGDDIECARIQIPYAKVLLHKNGKHTVEPRTMNVFFVTEHIADKIQALLDAHPNIEEVKRDGRSLN